MGDFKRITDNVHKMIEGRASPDQIKQYINSEGLTQDQFKARAEGIKDAGMLESAAKYSAGSGLANLVDSFGRAVTGAHNLGVMAKGFITGRPQDNVPKDPGELDFANRGFRDLGLINDDYAPTTNGGKILDFATQAVTGGGVNPFAVVRNAARGSIKPIVRDVTSAVAGGAAAGAGNVYTENLNTGNGSLDAALKIGGTMLPGMIAGGAIAARGTAGDRAAISTRGTTPEQWDKARYIKRLAQEKGTPITDIEAVQFAQGGVNPKLQTLQRLAEQSDAAANTLTPMMQKRPDANLSMFNKAADSIAPLDAAPETLAGFLQKAAKDSITKARQAGNNEASPHYKSAETKILSPAQEAATVFDPALKMAIDHVTKDPLGSVYGAPKNTVGVIDAAKKYLDDIKNEAAISGKNNRAANAGAASKAAIEVGDAVAPEYAIARGIVEKNMRENVMPMEVGQIGKLSQSDNFEQQARSFLPRKPKDVNEGVVERTAKTLTEQNPDIVKRILAQDLRSDFNEANQGSNAMGGANFAKLVADNQQQRNNLIQALKSSGVDPSEMSNALDIFNAQGYKPPVNSATFQNAQESNRLGGVLSALSKPTKAIGNIMDSWRGGMGANDLAKAIAAQDGSGALRLEELARANGTHDPMKQQMLINLLLSNPANKDQ